MSNLASKPVLIVGGSSGIGAATAKAFVAQGANFTIAFRSKSHLSAPAVKIRDRLNNACRRQFPKLNK